MPGSQTNRPRPTFANLIYSVEWADLRYLHTPVKFFGWTGIVPAGEADSACEQLGMDGGGRWSSVSPADERPQQSHFAH